MGGGDEQGTYRADSFLCAAAVHRGLFSVGFMGIVWVPCVADALRLTTEQRRRLPQPPSHWQLHQLPRLRAARYSERTLRLRLPLRVSLHRDEPARLQGFASRYARVQYRLKHCLWPGACYKQRNLLLGQRVHGLLACHARKRSQRLSACVIDVEGRAEKC